MEFTERQRTRFDARCEKIPEAGCWIWMGALFSDGRYGQCKIGDRTFSAHRLSYLMHTGEIPESLCVMHRCDTPSCVNPDHLVLGSIAENNADRATKGRTARLCGSRQGAAKLDEAKVAELRSLSILRLADARRMAVAWGVSVNHLYRIRRGDRWLA